MKLDKINFHSKKLERTNLHIYQYQKDYFQIKGVKLAKIVRKLLDEEIFRDMGGKNPLDNLEESKRDYEAAQFIFDEEKRQLDEMQRKFESIQDTLTRFIIGYCRDPQQFPGKPRDRITKEWEIPWENFKQCAKNYCETGEIDWTIIEKNFGGVEVV